MNIRWAVLTFGVAAFIVNGAATAAAQDAHEVRVGTMVNITTCVMPSLDEDDEFVLTNIVDVPAHPPYAGQVVYWVNDWKKIRDFVGKRIQFDAEIRDVDRKEIEVKAANLNGNGNGNGNGGTIVEIELNGNEVKTTPDTIGVASVQYRPEADEDEMTIASTLVKLKLRNTPSVVSGSCDAAAMRTAAVSTSAVELDTRLETETRSAAVIETETARVETPAVAVEVERPAAEVEVAAAAETPAVTEVAEVAEVEIETPAPAAVSETEAVSTTRTELPATATPLPLMLLLGLGSLSGAAALRLRRK